MQRNRKVWLDQQGGERMLRLVSTRFYEKVYAHPWLKQFFDGVDQEHITEQQTDFMLGALGGIQRYRGVTPVRAHKHMAISDKLFETRKKLLVQSLNEVGASQALCEAWLKIDEAFRAKLVKTRHQCEKRYGSDQIIDIAPPAHIR